MVIVPIQSSKTDTAPVVIQLPVSDSDLQKRLAIHIADAVAGMGLNVFEVNACVRIGLVCMNQGYTLLGAHDHAVKVARRIIFIKEYAHRVICGRSEVFHGG